MQLVFCEWNRRQVILTEGMIDTSGRIIYGVFATPEDAISPDADNLAVAIVAAEDLSLPQRHTAARNSALISLAS